VKVGLGLLLCKVARIADMEAASEANLYSPKRLFSFKYGGHKKRILIEDGNTIHSSRLSRKVETIFVTSAGIRNVKSKKATQEAYLFQTEFLS
jgi:hypothetical protein